MRKSIQYISFVIAMLLAVEILPAHASAWTIKENGEVAEYHQKKGAAVALVRDIQTAVSDAGPVLMDYWRNGPSPATPAQGRKFVSLERRGNALSEPFGIFSACRGLTVAAGLLWSTYLSREVNPATAYSTGKAYSESLRECQMSIDIPPADTVSVTGPESRSNELPDGCQIVGLNPDPDGRGKWTCPASAKLPK